MFKWPGGHPNKMHIIIIILCMVCKISLLLKESILFAHVEPNIRKKITVSLTFEALASKIMTSQSKIKTT